MRIGIAHEQRGLARSVRSMPARVVPPEGTRKVLPSFLAAAATTACCAAAGSGSWSGTSRASRTGGGSGRSRSAPAASPPLNLVAERILGLPRTERKT